jgi:hypothetical protein
MLRSDGSQLTLVPTIVAGYPLVQEQGGLTHQVKITLANEMEDVERQIEDDQDGGLTDAAYGGQALPETPIVAPPLAGAAIDPAAIKLTDTILGCNEQDLADILRAVAAEIGCRHISYVRLSPDKSADTGLLTAVVTYSRLWQVRYFIKQYAHCDPIINYGRDAIAPFDWASLPLDNHAARAFLIDAARHNIGRNGLTIPLRNRRGAVALISFTSDFSTDEWESYKANNITKLKLLSVLIDSAANINFKAPSFPVNL